MTTTRGLHLKSDGEEAIILGADITAVIDMNTPAGKKQYEFSNILKMFVAENNSFAFNWAGMYPNQRNMYRFMAGLISPGDYNLPDFRDIKDIAKYVEQEFQKLSIVTKLQTYLRMLFAVRFNGNPQLYRMSLNPDYFSCSNQIYSSFDGSGAELAYNASMVKKIADPRVAHYQEQWNKYMSIVEKRKANGDKKPLKPEEFEQAGKYLLGFDHYRDGTVFEKPLDIPLDVALKDFQTSFKAAQEDPYTRGSSYLVIDSEGIRDHFSSDVLLNVRGGTAESQLFLLNLLPQGHLQ